MQFPGVWHWLGTAVQQSRYLPSGVGQQASVKFRASHLSFIAHCASTGIAAWVVPQHVNVQFSRVGQHAPVKPRSLHTLFCEHTAEATSKLGPAGESEGLPDGASDGISEDNSLVALGAVTLTVATGAAVLVATGAAVLVALGVTDGTVVGMVEGTSLGDMEGTSLVLKSSGTSDSFMVLPGDDASA